MVEKRNLVKSRKYYRSDCRICYMIIYFILFLNVNNLKGNPFMNYFWQGLAELPGYLLGKYLSDAIGRKYTKFTGCIAIALIAVVAAYVLSCEYSTHATVTTFVFQFPVTWSSSPSVPSSWSSCPRWCFTRLICKLSRFTRLASDKLDTRWVSWWAAFLVSWLLTSPSWLVTSQFPNRYWWYDLKGTSVHQSLPYVIIAVLAVLGGFSGIFLPETLNEKLPETVAEAEQFGADQKVWSRPRGKILTHKTVPNDVIWYNRNKLYYVFIM